MVEAIRHVFQARQGEGTDLGGLASNTNKITNTAVFPVAGWGTRAIPFTPKNMAMIGNRPTIDCAIQEAIDGGIENLIVICSGHDEKDFRGYYEPNQKLMAELHRKGNTQALSELERRQDVSKKITYIFQAEEDLLGLGYSITLAQKQIEARGEKYFAVSLADDLFVSQDCKPMCLQQMLASHKSGISIASMRVGFEEAERYGIAEIENEKIVGFVEKPKPQDAPSDIAVLGRYILPAEETFRALSQIGRGAGGEIQQTDALALMVAEGMDARTATLPKGVERFDCGTAEGIILTNAVINCRLAGLPDPRQAHRITSQPSMELRNSK